MKHYRITIQYTRNDSPQEQSYDTNKAESIFGAICDIMTSNVIMFPFSTKDIRVISGREISASESSAK